MQLKFRVWSLRALADVGALIPPPSSQTESLFRFLPHFPPHTPSPKLSSSLPQIPCLCTSAAQACQQERTVSTDTVPRTLRVLTLQSLIPFYFPYFTELEIEAPSNLPSLPELASHRTRNQTRAAWHQVPDLNHWLTCLHLLSTHCIPSPWPKLAAGSFQGCPRGAVFPAMTTQKGRRREIKQPV